MWIVMRVQNFNTIEIPTMPWLNINNPENMVGFIPVFKTREEAVEFMNGDDSEVFKVRERVK